MYKRNCSKCGTEFDTELSKRIYCSGKCRKSVEALRWNKKNKMRSRLGGRTHSRTINNFIYIDKLIKGCSRCSERRPRCLQYHHINPLDKVGSISELCSYDAVVQEMKKCILLCANCHMVEELGDGYRKDLTYDGKFITQT